MKIRSLDFYGFCEQNYMQPLTSGPKIVLPDYKVSVSHDKKNIITITDDEELLAKIGLKLNGQVLTLVDAAQDDFELASVELPNMDAISNARYDQEKKEIIFTVKKMDGTFDDLEIEVSDLVDIYNAGKGLERVDTESGHTFNIKVAEGGLLDFDENNALKLNSDSLVTDDELSTTVDSINTNVNTLVGNFIVNEQKIDAALQAGITNVEKNVDDIKHILGTDVKDPSLKTQIDGNRTLIDALDAKIKEMPETYSVDEINQKIEEATSGKADTSDVEALENNLETLSSDTQKKITDLEGKKANKDDVEALSSAIDTKISDLEAKKANKDDVEALSSAMDVKISDLEKSNKADLDTLSTATDSKISALEDKKSDKADLEALSSDTKNRFESNEKEIADAKTRLDNAESSLSENKKGIDGIKTEVAAVKADVEDLKDDKLDKYEAKSTYYTKYDAGNLEQRIEGDEQEIGKKANSKDVNDALLKKLDTVTFTPVASDVETLKSRMTKAEGDITNKVNSSNLEDLVNGYTSKLASMDWVEAKGYQTSSDVATALRPYATINSLSKVATSGNYDDLTGKPDYAGLSEKVDKLNSSVADKANVKDVEDRISSQTANMATISNSDDKETYNHSDIDSKCNTVRDEAKKYADDAISSLTSSVNVLKTDYNKNAHNDDNTATLDVLNRDYHNFVSGVNEQEVKLEGLLNRIVNALEALGHSVKQ